MKKKLLLIISMFLVIFNVKALTFNVDVTNIEYTGNNGTIGSVESIDLEDRKINAFFQDIGDEVSFKVTITNSGDRAGTLRSIDFESTGNSIEYTTDLPAEGLSINGNDTNFVNITARVKEGAVNGNTSSEIKLTYKYDEGSCPEGEILSDDESLCLCPEGKERNETGICVKPETPVECADDEIYNSEKKICEKKEVAPPTPGDPDEPDTKPVEPDTKPVDPEKPIPKVVPNNPKTLDNIVLITLLFIVSGLGIYAAMYKKLNTNKKKITVGAITGTITLTLSFTVLASVFGIDNLLGAIVNPITKTKQLVIKVNERIDLIETWDGECSVETSELTPENIFEGGSGTESDPYQIKTAEQLSCFAASVNQGNTYEGKYIKQIKNIKLNDHVSENVENNITNNLNVWIPIGNDYGNAFSGTYDGDNHTISGLYINTNDEAYENYNSVGFFGPVNNVTLKNMILSDVYIISRDSYVYSTSLASEVSGTSTIDNIKVYGKGVGNNTDSSYASYISGLIYSANVDSLIIQNVEVNMDIKASYLSGVVLTISSSDSYDEDNPNIIIRNVVNNGNLDIDYYDYYYEDAFGGIVGKLYGGHILFDNVGNTGTINFFSDADVTTAYLTASGILGGVGYNGQKVVMRNCYNTGDFVHDVGISSYGGLVGEGYFISTFVADNCYNSGNIVYTDAITEGITSRGQIDELKQSSSIAGLFADLGESTITNCYNTGNITEYSSNIAGIVAWGSSTMTNCYNLGDFVVAGDNIAGLLGDYDYILDKASITNSYNSGDITIWGYYYGIVVGGITGGSMHNPGSVSNSYNNGNISINFDTETSSIIISGICTYCSSIDNTYNRGNITLDHVSGEVFGITESTNDIENVYNSGNITIKNSNPIYYSRVSGISFYSSSAGLRNAYNLGNIYAENLTDTIFSGITLSSYDQPVLNSVNLGNITLKFTSAFSNVGSSSINAISANDYTNCYNGGIFSLDTSELDASVAAEIENNTYINQIHDDIIPDILSIINGDGAYNDELDEDGLPTLKVFNN